MRALIRAGQDREPELTAARTNLVQSFILAGDPEAGRQILDDVPCREPDSEEVRSLLRHF